ncbi:serine hydrolase [Maribacter algarum]|uniref:Serine hydrolase n=1 Tax=Maribacter algarum (ex Zhang et al. 2020) TaxID=2578118 RepID=A0A5S3PV91_9FLAO|nr:serine hydrolase [Maribacter algarum]TMM58828.1 serine hydrolase [Maribacter algarum]
MKKTAITLLLLITVLLNAIAQTPEETLHHKLDSISKQKGLVGFGVSVFSPDTILYKKGYGYADKENKKPYTVNTVHNIGSISKTFVGVSLMKAVELGLFSMETPINDILPFEVIHPSYPEEQITITHLATHTSGIQDTDESYDRSYVLENPKNVDISIYDRETAKYMKNLLENEAMELGVFLHEYFSTDGSMYQKKNFLKTAPGERYTYSNMGAALAGYCIGVASGKSFSEFTQEHIFDKVKIKDIGWSYNSIDVNNFAKTYSDTSIAFPRYSLNSYPDGGLCTSVLGLTKYAQEMLNCYYGKGTILKQDSAKEMMIGKLTKQQYNSKKEVKDNYGYFWEHNRNNIIGHNGADPGIMTLMYYYEDIKLGAIFFTNSNVIDNPEAAKLVQASWNAIRAYQNEIAK